MSCCGRGSCWVRFHRNYIDDAHQRDLHWTSRRKDRAKEPRTHDKEPEFLDLRLAPGDGPSLSRQERLGDGVVSLRNERGGESAASLPECRVGNGCWRATTGAGRAGPIQKVLSILQQYPRCPANPPQARAAPRSPRPACFEAPKARTTRKRAGEARVSVGCTWGMLSMGVSCMAAIVERSKRERVEEGEEGEAETAKS